MSTSGPDGLVFLVGCPRSGTTLLQQQLSRHRDFAVAPETHFMRMFASHTSSYGDLLHTPNLNHLTNDIISTPAFKEMKLDPHDFQERCSAGTRSMAGIFVAWLSAFADLHHVKIVGEKTPHHQFCIEQLGQWFPAAKFIVLTRDPRAVVASTQGLWWSGGIRADARTWRRHAISVRRLTVHADRVLFLSYEEFVNSPDSTTALVYSFIGLARPEATGGLITRDIGVDTARAPWKVGSDAQIDPTRENRWQTLLNARDVAVIESVTWRSMRRFGYRPVTPLSGLLLTAAKEELLLQVRRTVNHLRARRHRRGANRT